MWLHFLILPWWFSQINTYNSICKHCEWCFVTLSLQQSIKMNTNPSVLILTSYLQLPMGIVRDLTRWTWRPDNSCSFWCRARALTSVRKAWQNFRIHNVLNCCNKIRQCFSVTARSLFHFHSSLAVQKCWRIEPKASFLITGTGEKSETHLFSSSWD